MNGLSSSSSVTPSTTTNRASGTTIIQEPQDSTNNMNNNIKIPRPKIIPSTTSRCLSQRVPEPDYWKDEDDELTNKSQHDKGVKSLADQLNYSMNVNGGSSTSSSSSSLSMSSSKSNNSTISK